MATDTATHPQDGFIDRIRDLVAKAFGGPGRRPQGDRPSLAGEWITADIGKPAGPRRRPLVPRRK